MAFEITFPNRDVANEFFRNINYFFVPNKWANEIGFHSRDINGGPMTTFVIQNPFDPLRYEFDLFQRAIFIADQDEIDTENTSKAMAHAALLNAIATTNSSRRRKAEAE